MYRYIIRRVIEAVPLLFFITVALFVLVNQLPGGPLANYLEDPTLTPDEIQALRAYFELDQPLPLRYYRWVAQLAQGDLGFSRVQRQPVAEIIASRIGNTAYLMGVALSVTLLIAIPLGIIAALKPYSWFDNVLTFFSFIGLAVPPFFAGLIGIYVFAVLFRQWGLPFLPVGGRVTIGQEGNILNWVWHIILPVSVLVLFNAAQYSRFVRSSMLDVINQDYIRTARAKGLAEGRILWGHAVRNAALPVITLIALGIPALFTGAVITETIFAWPGMGRLFVDSAVRGDYPVLMGIVTISAILVVLSNLLADILYAAFDPRIRLQ